MSEGLAASHYPTVTVSSPTASSRASRPESDRPTPIFVQAPHYLAPLRGPP